MAVQRESDGMALTAPKGEVTANKGLPAAGSQSRMRLDIIIFAVLAFLSAVVIGVTYLIFFGAIEVENFDEETPGLIIVYVVLSLLVLTRIIWRLVGLFRSQGTNTGSQLHARLVGLFVAIAIVPVVVLAVFSYLTVSVSLEAWFNDRVQRLLDNSRMVASEYLEEHQQQILTNAVVLARNLDAAKALYLQNPEQYRDYITNQARLLKLLGAYVVTSKNQPVVGALNKEVRQLPQLPEEAFELADRDPLVRRSVDQNQMVALVKLQSFNDAYLFAARRIDQRVPELETQFEEAFNEYLLAENSRERTSLIFALSFLLVALLLLLGAILLALWAAGRIVAPISRLMDAAHAVSEGDLSARVDVGRSGDEIATLGRTFNRMTAQLFTQRKELVQTNRDYDQRRRFSEAVLSGVTAGVIGLDGQRRVTLVNKSARILLGSSKGDIVGRPLRSAVPEFADLVNAAVAAKDSFAHGEVDLMVDGKARNLLVRITTEPGVDESAGHVVTFDDITELVSAQRMSAWADVARRIAHEIKNPLTPIQLSAERLRRKYLKEVESQPEVFDQCTNTIIRQVNDIGRMVDEFSSFARMPSAVMREEDITELVRQAVFLQRVANADTEFVINLPVDSIIVECDGRQMSQALTNLLKNASEAIASRLASVARDGEDLRGQGKDDGETLAQAPKVIGGRIEVTLAASDTGVVIDIIDNGCGLPQDDRHRLTEPYMTTRSKGTGLGLAIVKKIMEDHGGSLVLDDAPPRWDVDANELEDTQGAWVRLTFPPHRIVRSASAA